jgi:hypothetical protein
VVTLKLDVTTVHFHGGFYVGIDEFLDLLDGFGVVLAVGIAITTFCF